MLTKNFHALMALILTSNGNVVKGLLPVTDVTNFSSYAANQCYSSMPGTVYTDFTLAANNAGISVGSGSTAASANDYQLESTITEGISVVMNRVTGKDNSGYPYLRFDIMIANIGESAVTVSEIGYKQSLRVCDTLGGTSIGNRTCLIDRSVLASPVTISPGDYAVIRYILMTVIPAGA